MFKLYRRGVQDPPAIMGHSDEAVHEERARLLRELHDGFAQLVAHLLVRIDTVEALVGAELERMRSVTDDLYQERA